MVNREIVIRTLSPLVKARCPNCKSRQIIPIKTTLATCKVCQKKDYLTIEAAEPLDSYAALILRKFDKLNSVTLSGTEPTRFDVEYVANIFGKAGLGISVGQGQTCKDEYNKKECLKCGTCLDCVKCVCGKNYKRTEQKCPVCGKGPEESIHTYFKNTVDKTPTIKACPYCYSTNIKMTEFQKTKSCPKCRTRKHKTISMLKTYKIVLEKIPMLRKDG